MKKVFIILILVLNFACSEDPCRDEIVERQELEINIERLEDNFKNFQSIQEITSFLSENRLLATQFLRADQYPHDSILAKRIYSLFQDEYIDTLYSETKTEFADLSSVENQLKQVVSGLQALYPQVPTPKVQTTITGLYNDLLVSDSLIVIGLDFFLGAGATYRPVDVPHYILRRYNETHLVPTIAKFMSGAFVTKSTSDTMLSEIIDFGKTFYLLSRLLPCVPDYVLMGYTEEEMIKSRQNEVNIWANFVENEVLYETNHFVKRKFIGERPNVHEISRDCPGRIGVWIGWQIVESYMENNNVSIQELLKSTDNDTLFRLSKYKPQNR